MAQKVSVTYACDYDKKEIPHGQERTRAFGVDGQNYEIDLCKKHSVLRIRRPLFYGDCQTLILDRHRRS